MMSLLSMPCCGADPYNDDGSMAGAWDPRTGLCRHCGKDGRVYSCASPTCRGSISEMERFCKGCQGAFDLGLMEDAGPWHPDPAVSGPQHRAFPAPGYQLIAYEDGRWAIRWRGDTVGSGTITHPDLPGALATAKLCCVGTWKQHSRPHIKTSEQLFDDLMEWRRRMAEHHPECKDEPDGLDTYAGCHPECLGLAALMEYVHE